MRRAIARNLPLSVAVVVSTLFHLSMVSIFSIVIWFPRSDLRYAMLEIIQQPAPAPLQIANVKPSAPHGTLRIPSPDESASKNMSAMLNPEADAVSADDVWGELPEIEPLRLKSGVVDPLRSKEESLRIRSTFSDLFEPPQEPDSWARFSTQLQGIGSALGQWTLRQIGGEPPSSRMRVGNPAGDFDLYVEWIAEPKNRALLFLPPIQALRQLEPSQFPAPVTFVFIVDALGKVTDVQYPMDANEELTSDVRRTLLDARFEPMQDSAAGDRRGMFIVSAKQEAR